MNIEQVQNVTTEEYRQIASFCDYLEEQASNLEARKGERTKARLIARTAYLLETKGYRNLTQADICEAAGIGVATFYQYFQNKSDICHCVMKGFIEFMELGVRSAPKTHNSKPGKTIVLYSGMYQANLHYLIFIRANVGIFRCFLHFGGETDVIDSLWKEFNEGLYERATKSIIRIFPDLAFEETLIRTHLMGGMFDEFTRNYLIHSGDRLMQLCDHQFDSDEALALFMTDIWYSTVTNRKPPATRAQVVGFDGN